jgi:hypothetical protein
MSIALDRRVRDENGHMHVADSIITRGIVSDYLAAELQGAIERGYAPDALVPVYRDPDELSKALDSAESIPLMRRHIVVSADNPQKDDIIGVVTKPRMHGTDMLGDITIWSAEDGIDPVLSGEQEELSCGYLYDLDWTPGVVDGLRYVARMYKIKFNHCATVSRGRVPGARVADQLPSELSMSDKLKFPRIAAALQAILGLKPEQTVALDTALDAELTVEQPAAVAPVTVSDEDKAKTEVEAKAAFDAAVSTAVEEKLATLVDAAVSQAKTEIHALYAAREAVSDKVGVTALDSAEATYRFALDQASVDHKDVASDALPALWEASNKAPAHTVADQAPESFDLSKIFPGLSLTRKG